MSEKVKEGGTGKSGRAFYRDYNIIRRRMGMHKTRAFTCGKTKEDC